MPNPSTEADGTEPPSSKGALKAYADRVAARLKDVEEIFADKPYSPATNKGFQKFLTDQACEHAMRYVLTGRSEVPDIDGLEGLDAKSAELKAKGFTVAGVPPIPTKGAEPGTKPADEASKADSEDIRDLMHPAVQLAKELGFNPNAPDDDD
jgi:hypothetical protein